MPRNAYHILGLEPDASDDQRDAAFKRLARALHPDVNKRPTAEMEFKNLNWANETLRDSGKRREHDYALMKVVSAEVEPDSVDHVMSEYGMPRPKKKKKKKKKAKGDPGPNIWTQPPMDHIPPRHMPTWDGAGSGDYESIPDGFDQNANLGGIL